MHVPVATYRIQFTPDFGFHAGARVLAYLCRLGISDLYASPVFYCRPGSRHGYDVVDPTRLNPELGTETQFVSLLRQARECGLHWIQDIVPNHMAIDRRNPLLMDVLEKGVSSRFAPFFDIDWDPPYESLKGKMLLPVLGKFYAECLESGEIRLVCDGQGLGISYYDFRFPLRPGSYPKVFARLPGSGGIWEEFSDRLKILREGFPDGRITEALEWIRHVLEHNEEIGRYAREVVAEFQGSAGNPDTFSRLDELLNEQYYRLSFWKVASEEINYRRFFTLNDLISVRQEDRSVFDFTHRLVFRYIRENLFHGVRIDHIDGLYDPGGYLSRLKERHPGLYVAVEKILGVHEWLPGTWTVEGTTGYDFLGWTNALFVQKSAEKEFTKFYYKRTGRGISFEDLVTAKKRLIIGTHLAGNIDMLAFAIKNLSAHDRYGWDLTLYGLKRALVEIFAHFPVYRTYINQNHVSSRDKEYLRSAIEKAKNSAPGFLLELEFIERKMLLSAHGRTEEEKIRWREFVMNFQQFTAPLMAKGFEDTIFYLYNRFVSLNEVGGDPVRFGVSAADYHEWLRERARTFPLTWNASSTHDTKRGEDVRARLNVLSEIPHEWQVLVKGWMRRNKGKKRKIGGKFMPDANDEYFLYQTLVGALPFSPEEHNEFFRDRIKAYLVKAVREAKEHTAWIKPDTEYEEAACEFTDRILEQGEENAFWSEFRQFQSKIAFFGIFNSLSQTLLKMTAPGIPDFYQGCELWNLCLVDPDNRREVDFGLRERLLREIEDRVEENIQGCIEELLGRREDGRIKMFLIRQALSARVRYPELFSRGEYLALEVQGERKDHIFAYMRRNERAAALVCVPRFLTGVIKQGQDPLGTDVWQDTAVGLPENGKCCWRNVFTGQQHVAASSIPAAEILSLFPVALLISEEEE
ncbi:MAG: malto-oligosyltrehalose synthase [Candidatus Omnitrophica bacterium]|nr:malto-oligosyltrehalose synthase [Candidatus Omnitrophota bacterium]